MITLDPPDTPLYRHALRGVRADLSQLGATFSGTDLHVNNEVTKRHFT